MPLDQLKKLAPNLHIHFPEASGFESLQQALESTTHLLIVAHPDDDALVGGEALSECFASHDKHMTVVVASASPGTNKPIGYSNFSDEQMTSIRRQEQVDASETGQYAAALQLGFQSAQIKGFESKEDIEGAIKVRDTVTTLLEHTPNLEKLYTHSLFDAHNTHWHLTMQTLDAARIKTPSKLSKAYGVEVSSSLSWLPTEYRELIKIDRLDLVKEALGHYKTELAKRDYVDGIEARVKGNEVWQRDKIPNGQHHFPNLCALDYLPIINAPESVPTFTAVEEFKAKILKAHHTELMRADSLASYDQS